MNNKQLNRIGKALMDKYNELQIDEKIAERINLVNAAGENEDEIRFICMVDFFSPLNKWIKANITSSDFDIAYSYNSLRFDVIFNLKEKSYIGSHSNTRNRIRSAIKYQVIAHYSDYEEYDKMNKIQTAFLYGCKLLKCINNSCTFNVSVPDISTGIYTKQYVYNPVSWNVLVNIAKEVIDEIENENFDVKDVTDHIHTMNPIKQNTIYHMEKRITKEELSELINRYVDEYKEKPTINELSIYHTKVYDIEEIENLEEYNLKKINPMLMRKYINMYELKDCVKAVYNVLSKRK